MQRTVLWKHRHCCGHSTVAPTARKGSTRSRRDAINDVHTNGSTSRLMFSESRCSMHSRNAPAEDSTPRRRHHVFAGPALSVLSPSGSSVGSTRIRGSRSMPCGCVGDSPPERRNDGEKGGSHSVRFSRGSSHYCNAERLLPMSRLSRARSEIALRVFRTCGCTEHASPRVELQSALNAP